jgi:hypothetical protein
VGEAEVAEDALDDLGLGEEGEDAQGAVASGAAEGIELVDASEELGPADAGGGGGAGGAGGALGGGRQGGGLEGVDLLELLVGPSVANDVGAQACVGRENAVVAVAMGAGRRDQPGESLEELEGREPQAEAAVGEGAGEPVEEASVALAKGWLAGEGVEAVEGEGRPGTVA